VGAGGRPRWLCRGGDEGLAAHPLVETRREEIAGLPQPIGIAHHRDRPLTSPHLPRDRGVERRGLACLLRRIAPIVHRDSIDMSVACANRATTRAVRRSGADYINCPLTASNITCSSMRSSRRKGGLPRVGGDDALF